MTIIYEMLIITYKFLTMYLFKESVEVASPNP